MVEVVLIAIKKVYIEISAIKVSAKVKSRYNPFQSLTTLVRVHGLFRYVGQHQWWLRSSKVSITNCAICGSKAGWLLLNSNKNGRLISINVLEFVVVIIDYTAQHWQWSQQKIRQMILIPFCWILQIIHQHIPGQCILANLQGWEGYWRDYFVTCWWIHPWE